jgi:acetyl esterase/lipase
MKTISFFIFLLGNFILLFSQEGKYNTKTDVPYYSTEKNNSDSYIKERCVLDIYYPTDKKDFATIIWFHGGGLTEGNKFIPEALKNKGICIVAPNYRLYPKIKAPAYLEDAAAAVSWVFKNIRSFGGDSSLIFVSGHSAGGYLTSMIGLDKKWLKAQNIDANKIAGLIPFSGHAITHFAIREERGMKGNQPLIDEYAPIYYVRPDAPPMLLITGDRELELLGRYEENAYLYRMMKVAGHKDIRIYEIGGYGHNMMEPAFPLLINEVQRIIKLNEMKKE